MNMMKKPLVVAMGLLCTGAAFANTAQTTQDGSNNVSDTDQTGSGNTAYVYQLGNGNRADVDQTGQGITARINTSATLDGNGDIQVEGAANTNGSVQITQTNGGAAVSAAKSAIVVQDGVTGTGSTAPYDVVVNQSGATAKTALVNQLAGSNLATASVTQSGAGEHDARVDQRSTQGAGATGYDVIVTQSGDGAANSAEVIQDNTNLSEANVNQAGGGNRADTRQFGGGTSSIDVDSVGTNAIAYAEQQSTSNSDIVIDQRVGDGNDANVYQEGDTNFAEVIQILDTHDADIDQSGMTNFARVSQYGGVSNTADVTQSGMDNWTGIGQAGDTTIGNNTVTVTQSGNANNILFEQRGNAGAGSNATATITQAGSNSQFTVYQNANGGTGQTLTVTGTNLDTVATYAYQDGGTHTATITQTNVTGGAGLIAPVFVEEYGFTGRGGTGAFDVSVVQRGNSDHGATVDQVDTIDAVASVVQDGDFGAVATVDQSNAGNNLEAFVTQGGNSNTGVLTAEITQESEYNRGTIDQNGGDHLATITQSGLGTSGSWNEALITQINGTGFSATITQQGGAGNSATITQSAL